jgi:hypothetical protein
MMRLNLFERNYLYIRNIDNDEQNLFQHDVHIRHIDNFVFVIDSHD